MSCGRRDKRRGLVFDAMANRSPRTTLGWKPVTSPQLHSSYGRRDSKLFLAPWVSRLSIISVHGSISYVLVNFHPAMRSTRDHPVKYSLHLSARWNLATIFFASNFTNNLSPRMILSRCLVESGGSWTLNTNVPLGLTGQRNRRLVCHCASSVKATLLCTSRAS